MLTLTGSLLVLLTWMAALGVVIAVGLPISMLGGPKHRADVIRVAMWWGLGIVTLVVLVMSLAGPLASGSVLTIIVVMAVILGALGIYLVRRVRLTGSSSPGLWTWFPLACALAIAVVYLSAAAMGPVTNYDSGLYHLGAIRYQQEFGLVPGIANLYFPLGYGNSVIPLAAAFGSTPWSLDGFRLFNGFLLVLLAVETILRLRSRTWPPGTWLMVISVAFVWVPLTALADYWVTSPTSDSAVLVLTCVAVAYLADAMLARPAWARSAGVAVVASTLLVSMRPTMTVFAAVVVAVVLIRAFTLRSRPSRGGLWIAVASASLAVAMAVVQAMRDRVLSGWLQYPLSVFDFAVPWRAPDPVYFRQATLGAARNPDDLWRAAESWDWIPIWISRLPQQWESALAMCLILASTVFVMWAVRARILWRPRAMVLALLPSLIATVAWFVASPPAFRFAWGPIFTLAAVPGAFAIAALARQRRVLRRVLPTGGAIVLVAVVLFSAVARMPWQTITEVRKLDFGIASIDYGVTPLPLPETRTANLASGQGVRLPIASDQCWGVYPMCSAQFEATVRMATRSLDDGFLP